MLADSHRVAFDAPGRNQSIINAGGLEASLQLHDRFVVVEIGPVDETLDGVAAHPESFALRSYYRRVATARGMPVKTVLTI